MSRAGQKKRRDRVCMYEERRDAQVERDMKNLNGHVRLGALAVCGIAA
jgi:hypothetical protein